MFSSVRPLLAAAVGGLPLFAVAAPLALPAAAPAQEQAEQQAPPPKPVDRDALKATIPAELAGVKRSNVSASRQTLGDVTIVTVESEFHQQREDQASPRLQLTVNDYGSASEMLKMMTFAQFDRTTEAGYERTTFIGGFPAIERFEQHGEGEDVSRTGEANIILGDRLHVMFQTDALTQEQFKAALDELPLAEMAALVGAKPAEGGAAAGGQAALPAGVPAAMADVNSLKAALPTEIAGMKRQDVNVQRVDMGEVQLVSGEADFYADPNDYEKPYMTVQFQDWGPVGAQMAAPWTMMEVDREGDDGFERTTKIGGHPAMEQYRTDDKSGTVSVLVGGRLIVTVNANNVTPEQLKQVVEALPLDKFVPAGQ